MTEPFSGEGKSPEVVLWHAEVMGARPRESAPLLGIDANAVSSLLIRACAGLRALWTNPNRTCTGTGHALEDALNRRTRLVFPTGVHTPVPRAFPGDEDAY